MPAHCATASGRPVRQVAFSDTVEIIGTSVRANTWTHQLVEVPEGRFASLSSDADYVFTYEQPGDGADRVHEIRIDPDGSDDERADSGVDQAREIDLDPVAGAARIVEVQAPALAPPPRGSSLNWRGRVPTTTTMHQQVQTAVAPPAPTLRPLSHPPPYSTNPASQTQSLDEIEAQANADPVPSYHADDRPPAYIEALMSRRADDEDDNDFILEDMYHGVVGWFRNAGRGIAAAWSGEWDAET